MGTLETLQTLTLLSFISAVTFTLLWIVYAIVSPKSHSSKTVTAQFSFQNVPYQVEVHFAYSTAQKLSDDQIRLLDNSLEAVIRNTVSKYGERLNLLHKLKHEILKRSPKPNPEQALEFIYHSEITDLTDVTLELIEQILQEPVRPTVQTLEKVLKDPIRRLQQEHSLTKLWYNVTSLTPLAPTIQEPGIIIGPEL